MHDHTHVYTDTGTQKKDSVKGRELLVVHRAKPGIDLLCFHIERTNRRLMANPAVKIKKTWIKKFFFSSNSPEASASIDRGR